MKNRTWKVAGILGGVLAISASTGTLVRQYETSTEITNDNSADSVLEASYWETKAAANVNTYANVREEAFANSKNRSYAEGSNSTSCGAGRRVDEASSLQLRSRRLRKDNCWLLLKRLKIFMKKHTEIGEL